MCAQVFWPRHAQLGRHEADLPLKFQALRLSIQLQQSSSQHKAVVSLRRPNLMIQSALNDTAIVDQFLTRNWSKMVLFWALAQVHARQY